MRNISEIDIDLNNKLNSFYDSYSYLDSRSKDTIGNQSKSNQRKTIFKKMENEVIK